MTQWEWKRKLFNKEHCDFFFIQWLVIRVWKARCKHMAARLHTAFKRGGGKELLGHTVNRDDVTECVCMCMCCFIVLPFTQHTDLSKCQSNVISACRKTGFIYLNVCLSICLRVYAYVCMCTWSVMAGKVKDDHDLFSCESVPVVSFRLLLWNSLHWACAEHRLVWLLLPHGRLKLLIVAQTFIDHRIAARGVARDYVFLDRMITDGVKHEVTFLCKKK